MDQEHIKQIFERADIQQIRELLTGGIELGGSPEKRSYADRLESGSVYIVKRLRKHSKDEQEFSDMYDDFSKAMIAYANVFLEIGMKIGARLMAQLLFEE